MFLNEFERFRIEAARFDHIPGPVGNTAGRLEDSHFGLRRRPLDSKQIGEEHGADQVFTWRRSYDTPPPPLTGMQELQF